MADSLDVVAVGILDESAEVVGSIVGSEAGLAIVPTAGRQSSSIKCTHGSTILGRECDMHGSARFALTEPQGRRAFGAEAYQSVALVLHCKPKRSQGGRVESLARLEVFHL